MKPIVHELEIVQEGHVEDPLAQDPGKGVIQIENTTGIDHRVRIIQVGYHRSVNIDKKGAPRLTLVRMGLQNLLTPLSLVIEPTVIWSKDMVLSIEVETPHTKGFIPRTMLIIWLDSTMNLEIHRKPRKDNPSGTMHYLRA